MHSCDLSQLTRTFDTVKQWTYLLFEEFFMQGDIEKADGAPASFLCDRETVTIAKEQPGFANFIVLPTWSVLTTVVPGMDPAYCRAQENAVAWTTYQETEDDKKVYTKSANKSKKVSINMLNSMELEQIENPSPQVSL